jgi:hypothetical protein
MRSTANPTTGAPPGWGGLLDEQLKELLLACLADSARTRRLVESGALMSFGARLDLCAGLRLISEGESDSS